MAALNKAHVTDPAALGEDLRALAQAVAGWPTSMRQVFTLRKVYGLAPPEIARRLGLTELDVERHLVAAALACAAGCGP